MWVFLEPSLPGTHSKVKQRVSLWTWDWSMSEIVPREELTQMTRGAVGRIPTNELRSFRRADLVIEATDGRSTHYISMEASYTADQRDTDRAQRNARFLTEFTGQTAHPVIASVRNDHYAEQQIESGAVYWLPLDDRGPAPVE